MQKRQIKVAHSPDSDDAFMFFALKHGKVMSDKYDFKIERQDIEALNKMAYDEVYDITALSVHAYAHLTDKYVLTSSGASMAEDDYGPVLVAKNHFEPEELHRRVVAIPGEGTTAALLLKIFEPNVVCKVMSFDKIIDAVVSEEVCAGLLIHEGQLQYEQYGLTKVLSLIDVWKMFAGDLPLPLGASAIKKSLGQDVAQELSSLQKKSIEYSMCAPSEAREYALKYKRDMSHDQLVQYLSWYANRRTLNVGEDGIKAMDLLFDLAYEKGLIENKVTVEII